MKKLFLIWTVSLAFTALTTLTGFQNINCTTNYSSTSKQPPSKDREDSVLKNPYNLQDTLLRVTAILVDSVGLPPYCGFSIIRGTYKFEIENVAVGNYFNKYIKVQFQCPREMGDNYFHKGNRYYMTILKVDLSNVRPGALGKNPPDNIPLYKYIGIF